jgi:hypothetical protein
LFLPREKRFAAEAAGAEGLFADEMLGRHGDAGALMVIAQTWRCGRLAQLRSPGIGLALGFRGRDRA